MRKSKKKKNIEHGEKTLKELHNVYEEGIGIDEYYKLLKEYKRLYSRFGKTIKSSDSMGNEIMEKNDKLSDNLQYTIKTARTKLLGNVEEHRKTKEVTSSYHERIKKLEEALKESYADNAKLEKKMKYYIEHYGEVKNIFEEAKKPNPTVKLQINPPAYKNMQIEQIIALELPKYKEGFILSKISLNDFMNMIDTIEESSSIDNFIFGIYKYLKNTFSKNDIILHHKLEEFYIISKEESVDKVKHIMITLNNKRDVLNFKIRFSIGITKFIEGKDTLEIFLRRCENAFLEAQDDKSNLIIK